MRDTNLLQLAFGLTPPWSGDPQRLRPARHAGSTSRSTSPPAAASPARTAARAIARPTTPSRRRWRHLNFFQHQAYLNARVPRIRCDKCGVKNVSVPWARPDSGFTLLFEALLMTMVSAMPVAAVARMVGEHDTRLWRVLHHYVDQARARIDASDVTRGRHR